MRVIIIILWDLINGAEFKHFLFSLAQVSPCKNSHDGHALKLFVWEVWCKPLEGNQEPWKENTDNCLGGEEAFLQRWVSSRGEGQLHPKITAPENRPMPLCWEHRPPEEEVGFHLWVSSLLYSSSRFLICTDCDQTCVGVFGVHFNLDFEKYSDHVCLLVHRQVKVSLRKEFIARVNFCFLTILESKLVNMYLFSDSCIFP